MASAAAAPLSSTSGGKSGQAADLFTEKDHAGQYAKSRPGYPPVVFDTVIEELKRTRSTDDLDLAVDIATGSGQAAISLAERLPKVIGLDISQSQLDNAIQHDRITYICAPAHDTGLPDSCADLVTVAQGIHWFELDRFYNEARRILKPGGLLAFWGYALLSVDNEDEVNKAIDALFYDKLGPYWHPNRVLVDNHYKDLAMPSKELFPSVVQREISWRRQVSLEDLRGYIRSWSAYNAYMKRDGKGAADPVDELFDIQMPNLFRNAQAKAALLSKDPASAPVLDTQTPVFMRLCS